jgi:hypothetical protein
MVNEFEQTRGHEIFFKKCIRKGPKPPMKLLMRASTLKVGVKVETPNVSRET